MRYSILFLLLFFSTTVFTQSQINASFTLPNVSADNNTEICLPITTDDFTDGIRFSFGLLTDPDGGLTFSRVRNLNPDLTGFGLEDFDTDSYIAAGLITVDWLRWNPSAGETCADVDGITLNNGRPVLLFEVCYNVSGANATQHSVAFFNKPDDNPDEMIDNSVPVRFYREAICPSLTGGGITPAFDGSVTIGVKPVIFEIEEPVGLFQPGDPYCIDIGIESGFDFLAGFQFGLEFDEDVLRITSTSANTDIPQNNDNSYRDFGGTSLLGTWSSFGIGPQTFPDGTPLVTVCFEIVGDCGSRTDITIAGVNPDGNGLRPIEVTSGEEVITIIPHVVGNSRLIVDNCNPEGFDVVVDCPAENVAYKQTDICVPIRAGGDFVDMRSIEFLVTWDPAILEYLRIQNPNTSAVVNVNEDFELDRIDNGILAFNWNAIGSQAPSLDEGQILYEVCFTAIGFGGTSPIVIADYTNDIRSSTQGRFDGLNPTNCAITVDKPEGVAIRYPSSIGFSSTQQNCFDLEVDGFNNVSTFSLYVSYSSFLFQFDAFTEAIPGVTATVLADGLLRLDYSGDPLTLADGTSVGSICLMAKAAAPPGDCSFLGSSPIIPDEVITTENEGNPEEVENFNGEACVLFPNGFRVSIGDTEGDISSSVCVPVTIENFLNVRTANIQFNFDPTLVEYSSVNISGSNWPGLNNNDFDESQKDLGIITLNFDSGGAGVSHAGGAVETQAFLLCFNASNIDNCFELTAEDAATPPTTTDDGDGSIIYEPGQVCLNDRLFLEEINAIPASCAGEDDGMITFRTAPRANNEDIFIRTDNPIRFSNNGSIDGLLPGMTNYTIYNANGTATLSGSIVIGVNPDNAAIADAGDDKTLSCGDNQTISLGGRDNVGTTYELFILQSDNTTRSVREGNVSSDGNVAAPVDEAGTYLLQVTSAAGCIDIDTVLVMAVDQPVAEVGETLSLDCNNPTVSLTAEGSSEGANVSYLWERINGAGTVLEEVGSNPQEEIDRGGRYRLTVTYTDLQCSSTAELIVRDEIILPQSSLPTEAPQNCDGSPVIVTIGDPEEDVTYSWTRLGETAIISAGNMFSTNEEGRFVVELSNSVTGCVRMDTVNVVPSSGIPSITPPDSPVAINCNPDTTLLSPVFENVDASTDYFWQTMDGRVVISDVSQPQARVVLPGTYRIFASNGACIDSLDIVVGEAILPIAEAGMNDELACAQSYQLTGSGITDNGNDLTYQWFLDGAEVPMGAAEVVIVEQPGTYFFEVTDSESGCVASDSIVLAAPSGFPEYSLADTVRGLGCAPSQVVISVTTEFAEDYDFSWSDPTGSEISTDISARAGMAGLYTVTITNQATNCVATDQVFVEDDAATPPFVAFRRNNIDISCESGPAVIDAEPSVGDGEARYQYTWSVVSGGEEPTEQGNDTLTVRTAGVYRLTIFDQETSCEAFRELEVTDSRDFPEVTAIEGEQLDCDTRETIIGINILDQPNDYTIQWAGPPGVEDIPQGVEQINITTGGTYNAVIINPATSCVTTVPIRVDDLVDSIAAIVIMQPDSFDCNNETITIDASESDLNSTDASGISWVSFDGNNITPPTGSLIVSVDGAGDYELSVTDVNGCVVRDTVSVEAALNTPFAQAGETIEVQCGDMPQLDGSESSPAPGGEILYAWSAEAGGEIISGAETARPFVAGPGTYQLVVTNLANGCADTSRTTVTLGDQEAAMLPASFSTCETPVTVEGNLPAGTTGAWTSYNDDGAVFTVENNQATVTEIGEGLNLVWTLSAAGCPDYSSDSLRITPEASPTANNDVLEVGGDENIGMIDLLLNDQRTGPVTVTLLTEPDFGEITVDLNGNITFESPLGLTATTTVDYEVCSTVCEGLCDQATLTIRASADGSDPVVFNAFTPNGDGMNDLFIFDILDLRPDEFPDNELIIFNRWGDILYEAKPYMNNWDGTGNNGAQVPEGTYYYILRLNVGEGDIIRGDVTVVR